MVQPTLIAISQAHVDGDKRRKNTLNRQDSTTKGNH